MPKKTGSAAVIVLADIAQRYGVSERTVTEWRSKYGPKSRLPFPEPDRPSKKGISAEWESARWPEFDTWHRNMKDITGASETYLTMSDIARHLNVDAKLVSSWRTKFDAASTLPFPRADKGEGTRSPVWQASRLPEIEAWNAKRKKLFPRGGDRHSDKRTTR